jgi:homoserine dehydrogenase
MKPISVVLLGLGTVGQGVYESLFSHQQKLQEVLGAPVEIAGILVKNKAKQRDVSRSILVTTDIDELLALPQIDVVFEAIVGIEPAYTYIRKFLTKGCHIITANKELLAHKGSELTKYAQEQRRYLTFEAAVAGGIPLLRTLIQLLQVNGIVKIEASLNGTSNYILSKMRKEQAKFQDVLVEAQALGYAEADPSNDILGTDSFYKLMVLSDLIYHQQPKWNDVEKTGITNVTVPHIQLGEKLGLRLKLLASLTSSHDGIHAEVKPVFVSSDHSLYHVEGVDNGIAIHTDLVGTIHLQGPGAGAKATASAMIEDLVYIRQIKDTIAQENVRASQHHVEPTADDLSTWVAVTEETVPEAFHKERLRQYQINLIKREKLNEMEGFLLQGREYDILLFLQSLKLGLLTIYPVSPTGLPPYEKTLTHTLAKSIIN